MTSAETRISLDMQEVSSQACVAVRRWDTGRTLVITLTLHGQPYSIAAECSAEFVCRRPNGSILRNPCEIVGNSIHYGFTQLTTSLSGAMDCEVRLLDAAGDLITSPKFQIIVYATIYDYGDASESEIANANTVKSANPAYAEVFMWSDGNPNREDRVGYFVGADTSRSGAMVKKATSTSDIRGVCMAAPGFASNAPGSRFDENSNLLSQYCYVGMMGFAPVIDNGTCAVNDRCRPADDGTAVRDTSGGGYLVVERVDKNHVLIMLDNEGDLLLQMEKYVNSRTTWLSATLPTAWFGSGPYTQTVSVPGIPAEAKAVTCWPEWAADAATREKQREAWNAVSRIVPSAGTIAFTCDEDKPTAAVPMRIEVQL